MGELINYFVILAYVKYIDDPLKMGRVKCTIPGIMHADSIDKKALPWIRPFNMHAFQSFNMPHVGEKIWILASKVNLNEYWWFPYFETIDTVQNYIDEEWENKPDVLHGRPENGGAMITYDNKNGYSIRIGSSEINLKNDSFTVSVGDCKMRIEGNNIYFGHGQENSQYDKAVSFTKLSNFFQSLSNLFGKLKYAAAENPPYTGQLEAPFDEIASELKGVQQETIAFENIDAT